MSVIEFTESFNVRSLSKFFNPVVKQADYSEDMKVIFHDGATVDLAGIQVLCAMSKELSSNGKELVIDGLPDKALEYFNILNK